MDDDKIKEVFNTYQPELTSDFKFMAALERKMEAVEHVKQEMRALRRRNRIAVVVAAVAGFIMGALTSLLAPLISGWTSLRAITLPLFSSDFAVEVDLRMLVYISAAIVSAISAYNAYEIAIARQHK